MVTTDTKADVPSADEQLSAFAHLDRYEHVTPWEADSRLFAIQQYGQITIGQVLDDDLQLVTLSRQTLDDMRLYDRGDLGVELGEHRGEWGTTGETITPLSGWDGGLSHEIRVSQTKFSSHHEVVLTRVDACELLAWFPEEDDQ